MRGKGIWLGGSDWTSGKLSSLGMWWSTIAGHLQRLVNFCWRVLRFRESCGWCDLVLMTPTVSLTLDWTILQGPFQMAVLWFSEIIVQLVTEVLSNFKVEGTSNCEIQSICNTPMEVDKDKKLFIFSEFFIEFHPICLYSMLQLSPLLYFGYNSILLSDLSLFSFHLPHFVSCTCCQNCQSLTQLEKW